MNERTLDYSYFIGYDCLMIQLSGFRFEGVIIEINEIIVRIKDFKTNKDMLIPWTSIATLELIPEDDQDIPMPEKRFKRGVDA